MCSSTFGIGPTIMENLNYQLGGDLTDIVRASSGGGAAAYGGNTSSSSEADPHHHHHHWHFSPSSSDLPIIDNLSSVLEDPMNMSGSNNNFGDPFSSMRDPFLHDLDMPASASSHYFNTVTSSAEMNNVTSGGVLKEAAASFCGSGGDTNNSPVFGHQKTILEDDVRITRPCKNIFSNMIQISPNNAKLPVSPYDSPAAAAAAAKAVNSPRPIKPSDVVPGSMINASTSKDCLVDNTGGVGGGGAVQISSPRNPGLKRRKNQAKKVVCIPAPAAANSRQTGEVVPSDLWAWRKYGQKPIKGSPYPRGYYRCSSSKGCSARKQVERSRTDPNMLVITYTSEHNHPWPTQRNALAGSTRSQPSKNNNNAASSKNINSETQKGTTTTTTTKPKEEEMSNSNNNNNSDGNVSSPVANSASVKEEMEMEDLEKQLDQLENNMDQDGSDQFSDGGIPAYKPSMMENQSHEDFFAELGELEADPLDLLFTQAGFNDQHREAKASNLDPFHLFDWSGDHNTNSNTTCSFEEEPNKRRL